MNLRIGDDEVLAIAVRTAPARRVAKHGANRQNEHSRRRQLRRYGVI
jgi:hypothetical protein